MFSWFKKLFADNRDERDDSCCRKSRPDASAIYWHCPECDMIVTEDEDEMILKPDPENVQLLGATVKSGNSAFIILVKDPKHSKARVQMSWDSEPTKEDMAHLGSLLQSYGTGGVWLSIEGDDDLSKAFLGGVGQSTLIN